MADIYGIAFNIMGGPALKTLKQMSKEADNVGKSAEDAQRTAQAAIDGSISKLAELNRKIAATYALAKKLENNRDLKAAELVYKRGDALDEERAKLLDNLGAQEKLNKNGLGGGAAQGKSFIKTLGMVTKSLGVATIAAMAFKAAMNMSREGETLLYLAHSAGISAGSFQRAAAASELYGGSKEGVAGMMSGLMKMRQDLMTVQTDKNGLTEAARKYDISIFNKNGQLLSPEAILKNTAAVMSRWDKGAQLDIKSLLGIEDGTFNLMLEGYDKYIATLKAAKSLEIPEDDLKNFKEFSQEIKFFTSLIKKEAITELAKITPQLREFFEIMAVGTAVVYHLAKKLNSLNLVKRLINWQLSNTVDAVGSAKNFASQFKTGERNFMGYTIEELSKQFQSEYKSWKAGGFETGKGVNGFLRYLDAVGALASNTNTNHVAVVVLDNGQSIDNAVSQTGVDTANISFDRLVGDLNGGVVQ